MAVHRLTTASPPTTPRRSPRLPTRKRARASDSEQQLTPSSSKLPLTPDPSPRWIRAQKRQKILDGSSRASPTPPATPVIENGSTRARKRKSLFPHDLHESDSHHRVPKKKRKENIVNDTLTANAATTSLKISVTLDTRQGPGNNLHRNEKNTGQSQSLKFIRNTRSKSTLSVPGSKLKSKSKLQFTSAVAPSDPSCDPSSSSSSSRMMTRTMKKQCATAQPRSAPADSTHTYTTRSHVFTTGLKIILPPTSASSTIPSDISQSTVTQSDIPTSNVDSTSTTTTTFSDDAQPSTSSSFSSSETTSPPLSKSPIELSTSISMPLPMSISSLPISFMNVPLPMPLNLAFLNMPLSMPLSMPLNLPLSTDISTTLAPSESELGFGFQPQEEFSSTGREEGQGKGDGEDRKGGRDGEPVFPPQLSTPPLLTPARPTTNESTTTTRSSSDIFLDCPSSPPQPQSCTPCLSPTPTTPTRIPPRLVIPTCPSDQPRPTSTSPTSPTSSSPYLSSTSPTHSSPLKVVCFPSLQLQPFPSTSQWQPPPSPQQLPSVSDLPPSSAHERRMKEWAMDMADDQRQTERALEQEMGVELSLSFRNSSTGQGDELRLAQQELEEEQDRSPLLGPAPQPSSPQPPAPYPQLAPSFPSCPPSPACCSSSSSGVPSSSSRQYDRKVEYQHHQIPEWTPKLDKERNLWKLACKIRVWEITKRYTPDTIRTVVAQEAHDYYSAHGFPLGYGTVPVRSRRRRWRKIVGGAGSSTTATAGSDSDCASSMMISTPPLSPPSPRDDEFMNEETYSFELMDDEDDMDGSVSGVELGVGGLRSMEDEWRYDGFDDDEFGFDDDDDDDDDDDEEDYDDLYEDDDDEVDDSDEVDEVVEGDGNRTKISGNRKKGDVSFIAGEDQDQDPDAEGEMEIDIEPFQDPSFNAELSSPTSPTSPTGSSTSSKSKSRSRSNSGVGDEPQSFVSSFYIPSVHPHVQHMMQMQQQQQQQRQEEEAPVLAPSPLDTSTTNPLSASSEGTPISTFDAVDHSTTTTPDNENNQTPMQIHLPPASHHPHHYHSQLIQLSNILPLPPPRLDSVRVFILRQSEMGGLKTTGRGTPADRKRGAIWGGVQVGGVGTSRNKRGLDRKESESDEENGGEDEGGKRGRPRLRLMLSDHDIETGPRGGGREGESGDGAKTSLKLNLLNDIDDADERMPVGFKCDISSESSNTNNDQNNHRNPTHKPSSPTFVATDQTWDAFLASLDDKNHHQPPQQQGEEGTFDSSVTAADSDTTHGQLLLDLDGHHLSNQHRLHRERDPPHDVTTITSPRRLGPSLSPTTSLEGSSGMFMFDHEGGDDGSTGSWFGDEGGLGGRSGLVGSSGTCPSDALAMEGFNFSVGPDGSSTLSYALG